MESGWLWSPALLPLTWVNIKATQSCFALLREMTAAGAGLVSFLRRMPSGSDGAELTENATNVSVLLNRAMSTWGLL